MKAGTGKYSRGCFPGGSDGKNLPAVQETQVRSLSQENPLKEEMATHPLQYSCLENPTDRGAWWDTVPGIMKSETRHKESDITERLSLHSRMPRYHCASSRLAPVCCSSNRGNFHETKDVAFFP